ncbi:hypothetical protein C8J32_10639 [Rhizobium sp. PP-CC-3A-592]|nr:hypothetical protein C8J32_10639 [Rhizobium sp. PP-CC-3A-592]
MLALIARQVLGLFVVSSPIWGAGLLALWIKKDRRSHQGRKTSGSATSLVFTTSNGI